VKPSRVFIVVFWFLLYRAFPVVLWLRGSLPDPIE